MHDIKQITIERRKLWENATKVLYDMIRDTENDAAPLIYELLMAFNNDPIWLRRAFQNNLAPVLMGARMKELEKFFQDEIPFILVIQDKKEILTILSHEEIQY